jgi:uncharacterized RDD family membrane protein YckC
MTETTVPPSAQVMPAGHAGFVTRFSTFVIDVVVINLTFALAGLVVQFVVSALGGTDARLSEAPALSSVAFVLWWFTYAAVSLATFGQTAGMAVFGVRALRADGRPLGGGRAVVRVLAFPLSFLLFGFGFALIVLRRDRRALHDLIARTCVVYDWDVRTARSPFLGGGRLKRAHRAPPIT